MGTETESKSSNHSEIQPLAEFDPNKEPVADLDERDVIEPLKKTTDDTGDQKQENEPDRPGEMGADTEAKEQEIHLDEPGGKVEGDAEKATDDAGDESEIHLDKIDGEADEPDSDENVLSLAAASIGSGSDGGADSENETEDSDTEGKGKKPVKDAATSKKIILSIIIVLMVAGVVIYSRPAVFDIQGKPENALPEKSEIKTPAGQTEVQTRQPVPPGKNDHYLSTIEDLTRLRDELLAKREEIYRLKLHYRNGIAELKDQIYREMQEDNITTFAQALKNKRIELGLRTIQRREVYIQELEKPDQWVHNGSEELLFLKRKALLDLQMTDIASGIDLNRHMRYMSAALQKYQPSADKLAVDPHPGELTPLEAIWSSILNQQAEKVEAPIGPENKKIIAEICSGDYGRIAELTAMTPEAANCLSRMNGSELFLNGLTQLSPKEAEYLFKWQGNWICLNSVKNLSPAVAKHLFKWKGNWISLNGLTELPPELALYLTEWHGNQLELMGLNCEKSKPNKRTLKYLALWETMGGKLFVSEDVRNEMARVM